MQSYKFFSIIVLSFAVGLSANAQESKLRVVELEQPPTAYFGNLSLSPVVGSSYSIVNTLGGEPPVKSQVPVNVFGLQPDPNTGVINNAVLDDQADVVGTDLADIFGFDAPNIVVACECLESLGIDPNSGRFNLRLTVFVASTGTQLQWDTLEMDLNDPADIDQDGDTNEPDGIFDTGDGVLDQPFPLDPVGIGFQIDLDGDGDPTNDPLTIATTQGLTVGGNGSPVSFDPAAGPVTVIFANWELLDFDGEVADINSDGIPDGPFDVSAFATFNQPAGWDGNLNAGFVPDGNPATTQDAVGGTVHSNRLVVSYLSDIDNEFCVIVDGVLCGDVNLDGAVNLLDVQPFVALIVDGTFQAEADINGDGVVDLLDVAPFVLKLTNG